MSSGLLSVGVIFIIFNMLMQLLPVAVLPYILAWAAYDPIVDQVRKFKVILLHKAIFSRGNFNSCVVFDFIN